MRTVLTLCAMFACMASFLAGTALMFIGGLALQSVTCTLVGGPLFLLGLSGTIAFEIWS